MIKFYSIIALSMGLCFPGTTGKIMGNIFDKNSAKKIIGCNVYITELGLGTATDLNGNFIILNVPPGAWTLKSQMIGYSVKEISEIKVSVDFTTKLKIPMQIEAVQGEVISVTANQNLIKKDQTSSTAIVNRETLEQLPVNEISEVLELQAGFVSGHLRGGRSGEVSYMIDGIPITDGFDGSTVVNVNKDAVQEMQLISGTFNAEYGQAMSGIVNIVTREGRNQFNGSVNFYSGDFISSHNNLFLGLENPNIFTTKNLNINLSGSLIKDRLFYFVNSRNIYYQGYLKGINRYNPNSVGMEVADLNGNQVWHILGSNEVLDSIVNLNTMNSRQMNVLDSNLVDSLYNKLRENHSQPIGDNKEVAMDWNKHFNSQIKLIYKLNDLAKLKYTYIYDDMILQNYDRMYKFNPKGNLLKNQFGQTHILQYTQSLSEYSFINLGLTNFKKEYYHDAFEDGVGYVNSELLNTADGYSFFSGGTNNNRFSRKTETKTVKLDFSSQINFNNFIKTGIEYRQHNLDYEDINLKPQLENQSIDLIYDNPIIVNPVEPENSTIYASSYNFKPIEFSCYLQDKVELKELILNLGIRYDYFDANGRILVDPSDPSIYSPIKIENRFNDINGNAIQEIGESDISISEREKYWYKSTESKNAISPRFGASFPFSDKGGIHFSYGHFVQIPRFNLLYLNSDFDLGHGTGNVGVVGNANLNPEKTISYEIGLQQLIQQNTRLDFTLYLRDIRDLTGTRSEEIPIFGGVSHYNKLVNSDFAFVKGVVFSLMHQNPNNGFSYNLDYTWQYAEGTASDPYQAQQASSSGQLPEIHLISLDWDQRHTLNFNLNYSAKNIGFSILNKLGSGLPYTPESTEDITSLIKNSENKPISFNTDLRAFYNFKLYNYSMSCYLKIFNVFDKLNQYGVYADTGVADRTKYLNQAELQNINEYINSIEEWFTNETFYSSPRRVEIGVDIDF